MVEIRRGTPPQSPVDLFAIPAMKALEGMSRTVAELLGQNESQTSTLATPPPSPAGTKGVQEMTLSVDENRSLEEGIEWQKTAIMRRFSSKSLPTIGIDDYLNRIHQICPLCTSVYLSAALYLGEVAKFVSITPFTVHRLVLAALRIATKNLEDAAYSQRRFAKAGGLTSIELSRLEIGKWTFFREDC